MLQALQELRLRAEALQGQAWEEGRRRRAAEAAAAAAARLAAGLQDSGGATVPAAEAEAMRVSRREAIVGRDTSCIGLVQPNPQLVFLGSMRVDIP